MILNAFTQKVCYVAYNLPSNIYHLKIKERFINCFTLKVIFSQGEFQNYFQIKIDIWHDSNTRSKKFTAFAFAGAGKYSRV